MVELVIHLVILAVLPNRTIYEKSFRVRLSRTSAWLIETLFGREILLILVPFRYNWVFVHAQVGRGISQRLDMLGGMVASAV